LNNSGGNTDYSTKAAMITRTGIPPVGSGADKLDIDSFLPLGYENHMK
jgi:hypothetical protein